MTMSEGLEFSKPQTWFLSGVAVQSLWQFDTGEESDMAGAPDGVGVTMYLSIPDSGSEQSINVFIASENVADVVQAIVSGLRGRKPGEEGVPFLTGDGVPSVE